VGWSAALELGRSEPAAEHYDRSAPLLFHRIRQIASKRRPRISINPTHLPPGAVNGSLDGAA
jgi:hypothetical protein